MLYSFFVRKQSDRLKRIEKINDFVISKLVVGSGEEDSQKVNSMRWREFPRMGEAHTNNFYENLPKIFPKSQPKI